MKNPSLSAPGSTDNIRLLLTAQDDHLHGLRDAVVRFSGELPGEICGMLADHLRLLEETERQLWAAFSEKPASSEHRMTMYCEQYY